MKKTEIVHVKELIGEHRNAERPLMAAQNRAEPAHNLNQNIRSSERLQRGLHFTAASTAVCVLFSHTTKTLLFLPQTSL